MPDTKHSYPEIAKFSRPLARRFHEPLWLGSRFLDSEQRNLIECVLGFDAELLTIAQSVSEQTLGQIRFQWWRERTGLAPYADSARLPGNAIMLAPLLQRVGPDDVTALIDAREAAFLAPESSDAGHAALFRLIWRFLDERLSDPRVIEPLAVLYAASDPSRVEADANLKTALETLALELDQDAGPGWALISAFTFVTDWVTGRRPSAIEKRWRIWRSFLAGEKALSKTFMKLAVNLA